MGLTVQTVRPAGKLKQVFTGAHMTTLLIAVGSFFGFIVAYHTYGRWLAGKIFQLDAEAITPSHELRDDVDYVPTGRHVIFGHHFTSIAGTGPIVGPAIAVFWGWLPALLWVVLGSIFIGAVHDFGALVVSLRNRGQTLGEVAGRIINPRAQILFLLVLFFALSIVLAIFGLVIAIIFKQYPASVLSVWVEIPIAIGIGFWVHKRGGGLLLPSLAALAVLYLCVWLGSEYEFLQLTLGGSKPIIGWTVILLTYCFFASVLPVWTLLQPRDFINSHQLIVALGLLVIGLGIAGFTNKADITQVPAIAENVPVDAPPVWPFLFITIACGAVSGFHCLVSSGTSSKQIANERDAQSVGYGAMLLEGALAVVVILSCCAGVAMGVAGPDGTTLTGRAAWNSKYQSEIVTKLADDGTPVMKNGKPVTAGGWANHSLGLKVAAFVEGGANFMSTLGLPLKLCLAIVAVLVASFAATTLDTATRLQRYVIQELGSVSGLKPITNKYVATFVAVAVGGAVAMIPGPGGMGTGGMILWPLFGATNQLLAGLAFMVLSFYLWRRSKPVLFAVLPMLVMLLMPAWALLWQMFNPENGWWQNDKYLLLAFGGGILAMQVWMMLEGALLWSRVKGVIEEPLPPLTRSTAPSGPAC